MRRTGIRETAVSRQHIDEPWSSSNITAIWHLVSSPLCWRDARKSFLFIFSVLVPCANLRRFWSHKEVFLFTKRFFVHKEVDYEERKSSPVLAASTAAYTHRDLPLQIAVIRGTYIIMYIHTYIELLIIHIYKFSVYISIYIYIYRTFKLLKYI